MMPALRHRRRDAGMTLIEMITVVTILGAVSVVVLAAVSVVFRTHAGVVNTTASSHDLQHAVSFFHSDVQSAAGEVAGFRATSGAAGDTGSGCSESGNDNVLRLDTGERRIAYRLVTDGDTAVLDRHRCVADGSAWVEESSINVADALDPTNGPAAAATVVAVPGDPSSVDRVVLSLSSKVLGEQEISAAPREGVLAPPPAPTLTPSACDTANPIAAAAGSQSIVRGDFHLARGNVWRSLVVGGALSFEVRHVVGLRMRPGDSPSIAGLEGAALYTGSIDWSRATASRARVMIGSGADAAIADLSNSERRFIQRNEFVYEAGDRNRWPRLVVLRSADLLTGPIAFDFAEAFDDLAGCSRRLAQLPGVCDDCASHVGLTALNGGAYEGTSADSRVLVALDPDRANTLNLTDHHLSDLTHIRVSDTPTASAPLIINVATGADAALTLPNFKPSSSDYIVWNFPDVTGTLTLSGSVSGTILAPTAHVATDSVITGGIIASSVDYSGTAINSASRSFEGEIAWDG